MNEKFAEEFYDTWPLQRPNPTQGLNLMCRKTTQRIARLRRQQKESVFLEKILRKYRDYALDNRR